MATNAYYLNQFISTTLSTVGGIDDSQTTGIKIASTSGVTTDKPGILCLSYSDPIDITKAEWISYTSIDVFNELQGVTRGEEGFSAKKHSNGVTVAFPISRSHINNLNDALIIDGDETNLVEGVISPSGTSTNPSTELVTKSYADGGLVISLSRQAIINGNFDVWQRGTSFSISGTNPAVFGADRWRDTGVQDGGTFPTLTRTREMLTSGDIGGAFYYSRLTTDGAGSSLGVNSFYLYDQKIENGTRNLCGNGKTVTVSFYARSDIANKKLGFTVVQNYGSGGSPSTIEYIQNAPITLTSTWTKYTATFTTNTLSGKTFGTNNNDYLGLRFWLEWGATLGGTQLYTGVSAETFVGAGNIDIAQVQLCAGDVALPFMPKSFEEELRACQRYYEKTDYLLASSGIYATGYWKVTKRISPTITITNRSTGSGGAVGASSYNPTSSFWITSYATDAANAEIIGEAEL